jgi:uncharacterized protein
MPTIVHGEFEWDDEKARKNVEKHGVTFEEAVRALGDYFAFDFVDDGDPENLITLAASSSERILYVVSTIRGERVRIISARYAIKSERKRYEQR